MGLAICAVSLAIGFAGHAPVERTLLQVDLPDRGYLEPANGRQGEFATDADGRVYLPARYTVLLDLPAVLRSGEKEPVRASIRQTGEVNSLSSFAGWQASVEGSLSFTDLSVQPGGSIYQRLVADRPAQFTWQLACDHPPRTPGTLWLYLLYTSPQGGEPVRVLALARPLAFEVSDPLGIRGLYLRIAGGLGLLAGGLLLFPAVSGLLLKARKIAQGEMTKSDK